MMRSYVYSNFVLPKLDAKSYAHLGENLAKGKVLERLPLSRNLDEQWRNTQQMLQNAYDSVPFYKKRFDENGISPAEIKAPSDLQRIPVLTREDIRNNFETLVSDRFNRADLLEAATGGTTDSPVRILRDPECIARRNAIQVQFESWAGLNPGDKVFYLWGARIDFAEDPSWRWRFFVRRILRQVWAPTSLLNESVLAKYSRDLDAFRPKAIVAYPTPLAVFSEYLLASGYRGHLPRTAISTAEPLLPEQREIIERALGCKVFELYGARDFGMVGGECEMHDGFHLNPQTIFAEIIPVQGGSGLSDIIATELLNPAFPFIRYKINDCVYPRDPQCSCGRGFPLIGKIEGRVTDNFYLPNGDLVPGVSLTNRVIKMASGIKKMQVIQEQRDLFIINYVPDASFGESSLPKLRDQFKAFIGADVTLEFKEVDEIARERSGKTRLCISRVKP